MIAFFNLKPFQVLEKSLTDIEKSNIHKRFAEKTSMTSNGIRDILNTGSPEPGMGTIGAQA